MKKMILLTVMALFTITVFSQEKSKAAPKPDPSKKLMLVEASCGQCQFKMKGKGCNLAVRIDGKSYFVEGAHIDAYGNAHASDGFCKAIRKAEVQGEIVKNKFRATYFRLLD